MRRTQKAKDLFARLMVQGYDNFEAHMSLPLQSNDYEKRRNWRIRRNMNVGFSAAHPEEVHYVTGSAVSNKGFGYDSYPRKGLESRMHSVATVHSVSEYMTSQLCSRCHGRIKYGRRKGDDGTHHTIPGVVVCPNCSRQIGGVVVPGAYMHRDVNASVNIASQQIHLESHGVTHPDFTSPRTALLFASTAVANGAPIGSTPGI